MTVLFWAAIGSVFSLLGGLALIRFKPIRKTFALYGLPFGAGALLAASFFDLLPEALEGGETETVLKFVLAGFLAFFLFERLASWFHHHEGHGHHEGDHADRDQRDRTHRAMIIVGDTIHNAIDGIAIGIAFLVDVPTGIAVSIAVAAHEIPQEIGDFGLLLAKGMTAGRVVLVNVLSAVATIIAALATFWLGAGNDLPAAPLLAVTAGLFIYIAASDIIPDIHEQPRRLGTVQAGMLLAGILVVGLVIGLLD